MGEEILTKTTEMVESPSQGVKNESFLGYICVLIRYLKF